jgi:predicted ferric reductase
VLLFWQFLLGYRQPLARWVVTDYLWTVRWHKRLGVAAFLLILLHPVFITPYYLVKKDLWLFSIDLPWPHNVLVPCGIVGLIVLLVIVVSSTLLRDFMSRRAWYGTHLTSYLVLPLLFVHGYPIGMTLGETRLSVVWHGLFVLTGLFFAFRFLARLGVFSSVYEVVHAEPEAPDVTELCMRPVRRPLEPACAQFAFFRHEPGAPARPFTISRYDEATGEICITVKAQGPTTSALQDVQEGQRFQVDGPYGVFGQAALASDRPIVMLAGGIGVTPFRRMIDELKRQPGREAFLFYGNQYERDIAHREEVESAAHVELVHVLSGVEEHEEFEVGFITTDLLREHLDEDLPAYEFLLCGPPVMVRKLEPALRESGVPDRQIHHELFTY